MGLRDAPTAAGANAASGSEPTGSRGDTAKALGTEHEAKEAALGARSACGQGREDRLVGMGWMPASLGRGRDEGEGKAFAACCCEWTGRIYPTRPGWPIGSMAASIC